MVATTKKKVTTTTEEIPVLEVRRGIVDFHILGTSPLICNRMSEKASRELLLPKGKKTEADKRANLKHNPPEEYRASVYRTTEDDTDTRILVLATSFKNALRDVALDMPDAAKSQIGRLTYVKGNYRGGMYVHVYGTPQLFMCTTRSADMRRTPDIRTRAIIPEWACHVAVEYTIPLLREQAVSNLLAAAGIIRGIGDWRAEKGSGNFGGFQLVTADNKQFLSIVKTGGLKAQDAAFKNPKCYDGETASLLTWFHGQLTERGFDESGKPIGTLAPSTTRRRKNGGSASARA